MNIEKTLPIREFSNKSIAIVCFSSFIKSIDERGVTNSLSPAFFYHKHTQTHIFTLMLARNHLSLFLLSCQYTQRLFSQSFNSIPIISENTSH